MRSKLAQTFVQLSFIHCLSSVRLSQALLMKVHINDVTNLMTYTCLWMLCLHSPVSNMQINLTRCNNIKPPSVQNTIHTTYLYTQRSNFVKRLSKAIFKSTEFKYLTPVDTLKRVRSEVLFCVYLYKCVFLLLKLCVYPCRMFLLP